MPDGDAVVYRDLGREAPPDGLAAPFVAGARLNGTWRIAFTPPPAFLSHWHWATILTMAILLVVLSAMGWVITRAISRPLRELAATATRATAGAPLDDLPANAPREVAELGDALKAMHGRLASHAEGRTAMLAAIAHDLGTPLSRLAFWVEQLPDDARARRRRYRRDARDDRRGDRLRAGRYERADRRARRSGQPARQSGRGHGGSGWSRNDRARPTRRRARRPGGVAAIVRQPDRKRDPLWRRCRARLEHGRWHRPRDDRR
ncbi:HAMP domain-containing histidine kinase [Sphingomonas panacisoli]|uniref:histidine kinase n=1 Tax=Sphingomonas panacisoli TaxID=1813879 RepID=A0A5B8LGF3_9SPHN|nr:HAMP domain-containing histidine kinase [Sphingomonas panacisoli]